MQISGIMILLSEVQVYLNVNTIIVCVEENMDVCKICDNRFKRRVVGGTFRGYYRRSLNCLLNDSELTVVDGARKVLSYQVVDN